MDIGSDLDSNFGGEVGVNTRMNEEGMDTPLVGYNYFLEKVGYFLVKLNDAHTL